METEKSQVQQYDHLHGISRCQLSLGSLLGKIMGSKNNHGVQHCAIGYPAKIPFWESAESQSSSPRKLAEQGGKS
jgi:hypothetical protein